MSSLNRVETKSKRGRPKKESQPLENNQNLSLNADSDLNSAESSEVSINLESQGGQEESSFLSRLKDATKKVALSDDESPRIETRGRKAKTAAADEFSVLVVSVLVLILSFSNIPDEIKPNEDELSIFSKHLSGILIRHLPISSKFSQDSLDIIGLVAVTSGYYARVAPVIKTYQKQTPQPTKTNPQQPQESAPVVVDALRAVNPAAADFLDQVEKKHNANNRE